MDGGNGGGRGNGGGGGGGEPKDQAVGSVTDESPDSLTPRHVRSSTQPAPKPPSAIAELLGVADAAPSNKMRVAHSTSRAQHRPQ